MGNKANKEFRRARKVFNKASKEEDHQVANGTSNKECHRGLGLCKEAIMLMLRKMGGRKVVGMEVVPVRLEDPGIISGFSCCEE